MCRSIHWILMELPPPRADETRFNEDDIQAGHYERRAQALQADCDQWEAKYNDMAAKHAELQKNLDSLLGEMGDV